MRDPILMSRHPLRLVPSQRFVSHQKGDWTIVERGTDERRPRYYLEAHKTGKPALGTVETWARLKQAREHVKEFFKALGVSAIIFAPLLLPGGAL
jgi:hypothetical protein